MRVRTIRFRFRRMVFLAPLERAASSLLPIDRSLGQIYRKDGFTKGTAMAFREFIAQKTGLTVRDQSENAQRNQDSAVDAISCPARLPTGPLGGIGVEIVDGLPQACWSLSSGRTGSTGSFAPSTSCPMPGRSPPPSGISPHGLSGSLGEGGQLFTADHGLVDKFHWITSLKDPPDLPGSFCFDSDCPE